MAPDDTGPAAASFAAEQSLPSRRIAASDDLKWRSILARAYLDPEETEGFTTAATPDLLVAIALSGTYHLEVKRPRGWEGAAYRPGAFGVMAPGNSATLRWRAAPSAPRRNLHLFLSAGLLRDTAEALGDPALLDHLPDALLLEDPLVLGCGRALWRALQQRADPLYADSIAQALATHMVYGRLLGGRATRSWPESGVLSGAALQRVTDYMRDHLGEQIILDDLAGLPNISKYHFLRVFSQATGLTPHRYLVRLRMQRAAELLRTSEDTVLQIAALCGYASPGQFAGTFRRHHGATPTAFRHDLRH